MKAVWPKLLLAALVVGVWPAAGAGAISPLAMQQATGCSEGAGHHSAVPAEDLNGCKTGAAACFLVAACAQLCGGAVLAPAADFRILRVSSALRAGRQNSLLAITVVPPDPPPRAG